MPKVLKRLTGEIKEKIARGTSERDSKYIIHDFGPIAFAIEQYGMLGNPDSMADIDETVDDTSVSSISSMATMDGNRGAGLTVDKYFYQPAGRRVEKLALRIAMPLLSSFRIFKYIDEQHFTGVLTFSDPSFAFNYNLQMKTVYVAGLNSLLSQTQ